MNLYFVKIGHNIIFMRYNNDLSPTKSRLDLVQPETKTFTSQFEQSTISLYATPSS